MQAVGLAGQGQFQIVVDKEGDLIAPADILQLAGFVKELSRAASLFSQLQAGGATLQGFLHHLCQGTSLQPASVGDGVKP